MLKELITCSKTKQLSSMRLIALMCSVGLLICVMYMVFTKDERLVEALPYLIGGLIAMATGKAIQAKFESQ